MSWYAQFFLYYLQKKAQKNRCFKKAVFLSNRQLSV